jgi:hypothetical protein
VNWWLAWPGFVLVVLVLAWIGYHFSLRTLRVVTTLAALAAVVAIPWYGVTLKRIGPPLGLDFQRPRLRLPALCRRER